MEHENRNKESPAFSDTILQRNQPSGLEEFIEKSNKEIIKDFEEYLDEHSYASELNLYYKILIAKKTEYTAKKWRKISANICVEYLQINHRYFGYYRKSVEKVLLDNNCVADRSLIDKIGAEIATFFDYHVLQNYVLSEGYYKLRKSTRTTTEYPKNQHTKEEEEIDLPKNEEKLSSDRVHEDLVWDDHVRIISSYIISYYDPKIKTMIKSNGESDYRRMVSQSMTNFTEKDNDKTIPFYSKIDKSPTLSRNSQSLSEFKDLYDEIKVSLISGKYKVVLSTSERMPCKDFISQSAKLVNDYILDKTLKGGGKNQKKEKNLDRFGIWMEIQSKWMDENKRLKDYVTDLSNWNNIFVLRIRNTTLEKGILNKN